MAVASNSGLAGRALLGVSLGLFGLASISAKAADQISKYGVEKPDDFRDMIAKMKKEMHKFADDLNFEKAAALRDKIKELEGLELSLS